MQKFEWDENKDRINKRKHDVSFESAAWVFDDEKRLVFPDTDHSWTEERWITIGMAKSILFVVYTIRHNETIRIISARKATRVEEGMYYASNSLY